MLFLSEVAVVVVVIVQGGGGRGRGGGGGGGTAAAVFNFVMLIRNFAIETGDPWYKWLTTASPQQYNNNNNNNTSICKAHNISIRAESEAPIYW